MYDIMLQYIHMKRIETMITRGVLQVTWAPKWIIVIKQISFGLRDERNVV